MVRNLPDDGRPEAPESETGGFSALTRGGTGFPRAPGAEEPSPEAIGPYRILRVLGQGGMGMVCLGEQRKPVRRQVAIKLIKLGMDTHDVVVRFQAEQQALALMSHPNIARVYEAGASDRGRPYFVMEYVPGIPLTTYCDRHRLSTEERLDLFLQICDAIQHAHHKGVIHRDIKPSNVLVMIVDERPIPKVIDFGIAKAMGGGLTESTLYTEEGILIGTPEYMSPEQAQVSSLDVDTRSDIYSLGVLLYELLVGTLPFDPRELRSGGFVGVQRMILERDPLRPSTRLRSLLPEDAREVVKARSTDLRTLLRSIRGDLDWIILKCLEKDRMRRYSAVSELTADVRRHLRDEPVLARPPGLAYRARKFARKHREPLVVATAFLVLVAAVLAVVFAISRAEFRTNLERLEAAVAAEDLDGSERILGLLEDSHAGSREVREAAGEVRELAMRLRVRRARELEEKGAFEWNRFLELEAEKQALGAARKVARSRLEPWQPYWEWRDLTEAERRLAAIEKELNARYNNTVLHLFKALEEAPKDSAIFRDIQRLLEDVYWNRYEEAWHEGGVTLPASFFKSMVDSLDLGTYTDLAGTVSFASEPPGADVYCFRYETRGERALPVPFDPSRGAGDPELGLLGGSFLKVEGVHQEGLPFEPGDRLEKVEGEDVRTRADLARILAKVGADQEVSVELVRQGKHRVRPWVPFPAAMDSTTDPYSRGDAAGVWNLSPGRLVDIRGQLGLTFAGYPLDFVERSRVGRTGGEGGLRVELPKGSYLFVLRKDGYVAARYPVSIPSSEDAVTVRLFRSSDIPPGFVYIPEGPVPHGGDDIAYHGLDAGRANVAGFFLSRFEVTLGEYVEFLNAPEVRETIDPSGFATPLSDWGSPGIAPLVTSRIREFGKIRVVPIHNGELLFARGADGMWASNLPPDLPLLGVPVLAGIDYALWLTRTRGEGRWRFRLPDDLEWEKAARGADHRTYVWGESFFWSFCRSWKAICPHAPEKLRKGFGPVGLYPFDESVYGIRDLAGSMKEPTSAFEPEYRFTILRGGEWQTVDERDFRAATRNRRRPDSPYSWVGLRLAADLIGDTTEDQEEGTTEDTEKSTEDTEKKEEKEEG